MGRRKTSPIFGQLGVWKSEFFALDGSMWGGPFTCRLWLLGPMVAQSRRKTVRAQKLKRASGKYMGGVYSKDLSRMPFQWAKHRWFLGRATSGGTAPTNHHLGRKTLQKGSKHANTKHPVSAWVAHFYVMHKILCRSARTLYVYAGKRDGKKEMFFRRLCDWGIKTWSPKKSMTADMGPQSPFLWGRAGAVMKRGCMRMLYTLFRAMPKISDCPPRKYSSQGDCLKRYADCGQPTFSETGRTRQTHK
jgi:hypothetical protein